MMTVDGLTDITVKGVDTILKVGGLCDNCAQKIFDPIVSRTFKISYFQQLFPKFVGYLTMITVNTTRISSNFNNPIYST